MEIMICTSILLQAWIYIGIGDIELEQRNRHCMQLINRWCKADKVGFPLKEDFIKLVIQIRSNDGRSARKVQLLSRNCLHKK